MGEKFIHLNFTVTRDGVDFEKPVERDYLMKKKCEHCKKLTPDWCRYNGGPVLCYECVKFFRDRDDE